MYAELTGELTSEERSGSEASLYPLLAEVPNIPIVMFGSYFGISERWVEKSDPQIRRIIEAQQVLRFNEDKIS